MSNTLLSLVKIETMSSLDIADLTQKKHSHILRDIRNMVVELYEIKDDPNLDHLEIKGITVVKDARNYIASIELDKAHTLTLITGYSFFLRKKILDRWIYLERQLEIAKSKEGSKKHQLEAMEALKHLLPEDLNGEALSYIKANTVVNKAVSNLFGFPKMLNKADMSPDMLTVRDKVLDDYLKLYEVFEDNGQVKDLLYSKYQPQRIQSDNP